MLFKLKTYIQFLSKASNQHGVHSPFVYHLVTLCFYKNIPEESPYLSLAQAPLSKKRNALFLKTLTYFQPSRVLLIGKEAAKQQVFPVLKDPTYTCVYFTKDLTANTVWQQFKQHEKQATTHHFLLIEGIHSTREKQAVWQAITQQPKATVTIDMYQQGLVFFRPSQEKEHFTIRV